MAGFDGLCLYQDLGIIGVDESEALMSEVADMVAGGGGPDRLFFLAHPPTVALGLKERNAERPRDLLCDPDELEAQGIALARSLRGGGITYHWPGQVVCYPVIALKDDERDVPAYMRKLEEVAIRSLGRFNVLAERRRDTPAHIGLWADGQKIVSMGIRISRWVTSFGFAVNLEGDFSNSRLVRPCGIQDATLTTLEKILGKAPDRSAAQEAITESFGQVFNRTMARYEK